MRTFTYAQAHLTRARICTRAHLNTHTHAHTVREAQLDAATLARADGSELLAEVHLCAVARALRVRGCEFAWGGVARACVFTRTHVCLRVLHMHAGVSYCRARRVRVLPVLMRNVCVRARTCGYVRGTYVRAGMFACAR